MAWLLPHVASGQLLALTNTVMCMQGVGEKWGWAELDGSGLGRSGFQHHRLTLGLVFPFPEESSETEG